LTGVDDLRPHTSTWMTWCLDVGLAEPLHIDAYLCRGARFRFLALIPADVDGDERQGPATIAALARVLGSHTPAGSVTAFLVVNPMALAAAQRSPMAETSRARCQGGLGVCRPSGRAAGVVLGSRLKACIRENDFGVLTGIPVSKE
jgi:hypothetical protein